MDSFIQQSGQSGVDVAFSLGESGGSGVWPHVQAFGVNKAHIGQAQKTSTDFK